MQSPRSLMPRVCDVLVETEKQRGVCVEILRSVYERGFYAVPRCGLTRKVGEMLVERGVLAKTSLELCEPTYGRRTVKVYIADFTAARSLYEVLTAIKPFPVCLHPEDLSEPRCGAEAVARTCRMLLRAPVQRVVCTRILCWFTTRGFYPAPRDSTTVKTLKRLMEKRLVRRTSIRVCAGGLARREYTIYIPEEERLREVYTVLQSLKPPPTCVEEKENTKPSTQSLSQLVL